MWVQLRARMRSAWGWRLPRLGVVGSVLGPGVGVSAVAGEVAEGVARRLSQAHLKATLRWRPEDRVEGGGEGCEGFGVGESAPHSASRVAGQGLRAGWASSQFRDRLIRRIGRMTLLWSIPSTCGGEAQLPPLFAVRDHCVSAVARRWAGAGDSLRVRVRLHAIHITAASVGRRGGSSDRDPPHRRRIGAGTARPARLRCARRRTRRAPRPQRPPRTPHGHPSPVHTSEPLTNMIHLSLLAVTVGKHPNARNSRVAERGRGPSGP